MYSATPSTPAGYPREWADPVPPTTCDSDTLTQEWLATSDDHDARTSGGYWYHQRRLDPHPAVADPGFQDQLLDDLARFTKTPLPGSGDRR
jgi:hypothetical protein